MYALVVISFLLSCQTIKGTFTSLKPDYQSIPEPSIREVAFEIERIVAEGDRESVLENRGGVVVNTEEIVQAVRTRAARREILSAFLDTGFAWERQNGLIYIITGREYKKAGTSRDRDRNALIVDGECQNRWTISEGIIKANNYSPRALPAIQRIFFEERLKFMRPGQKYESENGQVAIVGNS